MLNTDAMPAWRPTDDFFGEPFIDLDEWRDTPARHRYIHGGFKNTDTKFSFYFPEAHRYSGRLFHHLGSAFGGNEKFLSHAHLPGYSWVRSLFNIADIFNCGAYVIESNQGHTGDFRGLNGDPSILHWRASAQSAQYSKYLAKLIYGDQPRYSYIAGYCGTSYYVLDCLSKGGNTWDSGIPHAVIEPSCIFYYSSILANALRLLDIEEISKINESIEIGGHGDPYKGLTQEKANALHLLYRSGFPKALTYDSVHWHAVIWITLSSLIKEYSYPYFDEFWTQLLHHGADKFPNSAGLTCQILDITAKVTRVLSLRELKTYKASHKIPDCVGFKEGRLIARNEIAQQKLVAITVDKHGLKDVGCATLTIKTGAHQGKERQIWGTLEDAIICLGDFFDGVQPGDEIQITNRDYLAWCQYHKYQSDVDEFCTGIREGGRANNEEYPFSAPFMLRDLNFRIPGKKIIILQNMLDSSSWPINAVHMFERISAANEEDPDDYMRLWFLDRAHHLQGSFADLISLRPTSSVQFIDYDGALHQTLRDLIAWTENGCAPPDNSSYTRAESSVCLSGHGGIQPFVLLSVNGGTSVMATAGEMVDFEVVSEMPKGVGVIVRVECDFEGNNNWVLVYSKTEHAPTPTTFSTSYIFKTPGTYYTTARVFSRRQEIIDSNDSSISNLSRARVLVTERSN